MKPIEIGLTGAIGAGKSSVAMFLGELGAEVVSGDQLGKLALEGSAELLSAIRKRFGDRVFSDDGALQRRELGRIVFSSHEDARWLTSITFPVIYRMWKEAVAETTRPVIVFDAALIVEWGIAGEFDHMLVVTAPDELSTKRMSESGRLTQEEIAERRARQTDSSAKVSAADRVISNEGSLQELRQKVRLYWKDVIDTELKARGDMRNAATN
jgi:dephospho-CoA kinase